MSEKTGLPDADAAADREEAVLLQHTLPTTRSLFDPESKHLLDAMLPEPVELGNDLKEDRRVAEYTTGDVMGSNFEIRTMLPEVKGNTVQFIPLELATAYVRRIVVEMKRMDRHCKDQVRELLQRCFLLEAENKRIVELNERLQVANDNNSKNISNVNQMRIDFATFKANSEASLHALKEEIRTLLKERAALKLQVEKLPDTSREFESAELRNEVERLKKELQDSESARTTKSLMEQHEALQQQLRSHLTSRAKISGELAEWSASFESNHRRLPSQKDFSPVIHLQLQSAAFSDSITPVLKQVEEVRVRLLACGFTIPKAEDLAQVTEERDSLKSRVKHMKTLNIELERVSIEKKAIQKELDDLKRLVAVPHRTDPEVSALRSQVEYLSSELTTYKGKSFALEIENRELHDQLEESDVPEHKESFRSDTASRLHNFDVHRKKGRSSTRIHGI